MILEIDILAQGFGVKMTTLSISKKIVNEFLSHGENEYPYECCGFIIGNFKEKKSYGLEYLPASNVKEKNRERRFLIDPKAYQEAEDIADIKEIYVFSIKSLILNSLRLKLIILLKISYLNILSQNIYL